MNTHADKTKENKSQSVSTASPQLQIGGESTFQFVDNRPETVAQMKLQKMANNSSQVMQLRAFQRMANNSPQAKQAAQLQAVTASIAQKIAAKPKTNGSTVIQREIKFGDEEAQERYETAISSVSTLADVIERLDELGVDIRIKVDDAKLGEETFGAFYHDESMIRITSLARSREIFRGHDEGEINVAFASNLSHELTHALDYFLTKKKEGAGFRKRFGKNSDNSDIKAEQEAEDEKYANTPNPKYSSNGGGVMRTEWRAWAIEAATTFEQMSKGIKNPPKQFKEMTESFLSGLTKAATVKDSTFYRKSEVYYKTHRATMLSEEGFGSKNLDSFFELEAVKPWLLEAEEIFRQSIQPFAQKAAGGVEAVRDSIIIDSNDDITKNGNGINKFGAKVEKVRKEGAYNVYKYNGEEYKIHNTLAGHLDGAYISGSWT